MTKREKIMLYFAVLLVALVAYFMVARPYIGQTEILKTDTQVLEDQIEMQNMKIDNIPRLTSELAEKRGTLDEMKHAYEDLQTQEGIATDFTKLVKSKGLKVVAFSQTRSNDLLEERQLELFPLAEVVITCTGTHKNFISLVDALNQKENITVLSLEYSKDDSDDSAQKFVITCLLLMNAEDELLENA